MGYCVGIDQNMMDKKVSFLSGGEQKRVQIAQIIMSEPDIVLLDEPTANLDRQSNINE